MNRTNLKMLIKNMKQLKEKKKYMYYNQEHYTHDCGTPSCIGGHAAALSLARSKVFFGRPEAFNIHHALKKNVKSCRDIASEWLDLNPCQEENLFAANPLQDGGGPPTIDDAITTLEFLFKTGDVCWQRRY